VNFLRSREKCAGCASKEGVSKESVESVKSGGVEQEVPEKEAKGREE